jgi:hypothetical protein
LNICGTFGLGGWGSLLKTASTTFKFSPVSISSHVPQSNLSKVLPRPLILPKKETFSYHNPTTAKIMNEEWKIQLSSILTDVLAETCPRDMQTTSKKYFPKFIVESSPSLLALLCYCYNSCSIAAFDENLCPEGFNFIM